MAFPCAALLFYDRQSDHATRMLRIAPVRGIWAGMAKQLDYHTIREIFSRFQAADPEPKGELEHVNAYTLVVAVALSAQATDVGVNRATRELFKIADTPQKMLDLGEAGLIDHIKTIGFIATRPRTSSSCPESWSRSMAARCQIPAPPFRRFRGLAARPPMWF